jgi:hypothetical protein
MQRETQVMLPDQFRAAGSRNRSMGPLDAQSVESSLREVHEGLTSTTTDIEYASELDQF